MRGMLKEIQEMDLKDGRRYWRLNIDGRVYSLWDEDMAEHLNEEMEIEYEFKNSGKYRNITEIRPVNPGSNPSNNPGYKNPEISEKDLQVIRMSSLKSAVSLLADLDGELDGKVDLTLEIAEKFERYIVGKG